MVTRGSRAARDTVFHYNLLELESAFTRERSGANACFRYSLAGSRGLAWIGRPERFDRLAGYSP